MPVSTSIAAETIVRSTLSRHTRFVRTRTLTELGRSHGAPLTAWLRIPLDWFQSYTQSYFPDETHASIRRTFTPHYAPHIKRIFCGFCGTPLTYWTESPPDEAEYMSVAIGSLAGDDQRLLEDLNLLPEDSEEEIRGDLQVAGSGGSSSTTVIGSSTAPMPVSRSFRTGTVAGIPWFEEMVEGSRLGRLLRTRRGVGISEDQSTTMEWEISEWRSEDSVGSLPSDATASGLAAAKRKRG